MALHVSDMKVRPVLCFLCVFVSMQFDHIHTHTYTYTLKQEGVERLTANGRFEDVFIGAKEGLERLWLEQMPFPFLVAGCVSFILMWMVVGRGREVDSRCLLMPKCTDHTHNRTRTIQTTNQNGTHTIQTTNQNRTHTIQTTNNINTSNQSGSSPLRTVCGCWRSSCR